jgi:hypothetical protein
VAVMCFITSDTLFRLIQLRFTIVYDRTVLAF